MPKFKNTKKKKAASKPKGEVKRQFPRNYRIIPEKWDRDEIAFFLGALFILVAILVISFDLFSNLSEEKKLTDQKVKLIKEQNFWQNEVAKRPDYRDAYYNLALVNFELRDIERAQENIQKAIQLDPNFKEGRDLQEKISGE